ncbi:MAG: type II toxin-antitoxin system MqsA family antitoxin [Thermodesulfobacteriota bacterium]|nr:type II toxin-antitoxin system MqsA family antitoxin [Thermodesulfobacteriota bacterium]
MKNANLPNLCPLCNGNIENGTTTFTVDYKSGVVVVRNVPAFVCSQCGEAWLNDDMSANMEEIVEEARAKHKQFEVIDIAA